MPEITIETIGHAVHELREEVQKKALAPEKIERLNVVLDDYEKKNQQLVAANNAIQNHEAEIKTLRTELETKGVEAGQIRERLDMVEIAFAKQTSKSGDNWKDTAEFKAMDAWVKTGAVETKTLRTDNATEGGVLVPTEMEGMILKRIVEIDPIRSIARVRPIGAKSLVIATRTGIPVATYEGEAAAGSNSQATYGSETLTAFRQTHTTPITRDMLMDSAFNMESEIMDDAALAFAYGEGNGFVLGTGFKQPYGFMVDPDVLTGFVKSSSTTIGVLTPEDFFKLQGQLKQGYNGQFVMNRRTLAAVRSMRAGGSTTNDGPFIWQPSFANGGMASIAGDAYTLANSMPDIGNDLYPVAYGDFRAGYLIVDRTAVEVIRDDYTQKKNAIVEFTIHRWNTGKVVMAEAIKILKLDAA